METPVAETQVAETHAPETPAPETKTRKTREKHTFIVHDPETMAVLARLSSVDYRYAALKCASKKEKLPETAKNDDGTVKIWLRKAGTKNFREYKGDVVPLDNPQEVNRSGRVVVYTKKPVVTFVKAWTRDAEKNVTEP